MFVFMTCSLPTVYVCIYDLFFARLFMFVFMTCSLSTVYVCIYDLFFADCLCLYL